ncbi:hypothetical protein FHS82_002309 [Pseudochelatococcus lubricantis]|uniref:Uncharacterized protein n=1 Tax=Pseudochelatococcus lubricantis TaxID=1538102 RepID=A0ABX0V5R2_9HYPH|nr:hypothetical protein [Pseudochelatococcus lubricantis]NIJ58461.1 hypothetical protein [Pseudochelatococcus lubricantis]
MHYQPHILNRKTGRIEPTDWGEWFTVTEVGRHYGVGSKRVRAVLHHMGMLGKEGRYYRLPQEWEERGYGARNDNPKSGFSFDTVSPMGQRLIAEAWDMAVADYEKDLREHGSVVTAREALDVFKETRLSPMTVQMEIIWVRHHFPDLSHNDIATVVECTQQLVSRYLSQRKGEIETWERVKKQGLFEGRRDADVAGSCGPLEGSRHE